MFLRTASARIRAEATFLELFFLFLFDPSQRLMLPSSTETFTVARINAMTEAELREKLIAAGFVPGKILELVIFNLPDPTNIDPEMLDIFLRTGGKAELENAAVAAQAHQMSPFAKVLKSFEK